MKNEYVKLILFVVLIFLLLDFLISTQYKNIEYFVPDKNLGWKHKPQLNTIFYGSDFTSHILVNDLGYEHVFEQQLLNLVEPNNVVIGISCSGNSLNVINGVKIAKEKRAITIGFLGFDGSQMKSLCDCYLHFQENNYQLCEAAHLIFADIIISDIMKKKNEYA